MAKSELLGVDLILSRNVLLQHKRRGGVYPRPRPTFAVNAVTTRFPVRRRIRLPSAAYHAGNCFFVTVGTHERHPWFSMYPELADQVASIVGSMAEQPHSQLYVGV